MSRSPFEPVLYSPGTLPAEKLFHDRLYNPKLPVYKMVVDLEDAVLPEVRPAAIENLGRLLNLLEDPSTKSVYVRVPDVATLRQVLTLPHVRKLAGFVVPKATPTSFPLYANEIIAFGNEKFGLMVILESREMTDPDFRRKLLMTLLDRRYSKMIECLRIGGNDLLGYLGLRRDDVDMTIYHTAVGLTIFNIINEFNRYFPITAPVFECHDAQYDGLLDKEVRQHILNGLFGQTVIHPRHLPLIRTRYKVTPTQLQSAINIQAGKDAVKGHAGKMDEATTHGPHAEKILERARLFGTTDQSQFDELATVPTN